MRYDKTRWGVTILIALPVVLVIMALIAAPEALAQRETTNDMITMTGRIDRIGSKDIVIDDTWFKLSDTVSIGGFKSGDRVTIVATEKYLLLKIGRAVTEKLPEG